MKAQNIRTGEVMEVTIKTTFRNWIHFAELPGKFCNQTGQHNNGIYRPTHKILI
jgi:hypothetical protein